MQYCVRPLSFSLSLFGEKHTKENKYIGLCATYWSVDCRNENRRTVRTKASKNTHTPKQNLWVSREIMKRMFLQRATWNETNNRIYYCVLSLHPPFIYFTGPFFPSFLLRFSFFVSFISCHQWLLALTVWFSFRYSFFFIYKYKFHVFPPLMPQPLLPNFRPKKYA